MKAEEKEKDVMISEAAKKEEHDKKKLSNKPQLKVKVARADLNVRKGPDFSEVSIGFAEEGEYEITEVRNDFGKLKGRPGWICLKYAEPVLK